MIENRKSAFEISPIVAKQNDGATGTIKMRFVKEFARFDNVTSKLFSNNPKERQRMEEEF